MCLDLTSIAATLPVPSLFTLNQFPSQCHVFSLPPPSSPPLSLPSLVLFLLLPLSPFLTLPVCVGVEPSMDNLSGAPSIICGSYSSTISYLLPVPPQVGVGLHEPLPHCWELVLYMCGLIQTLYSYTFPNTIF